MRPPELPDDMPASTVLQREVIRLDWLIDGVSGVLHGPPELTDEQVRAVFEEGTPVRFACGMVGSDVWVPGVLTRLNAQRCAQCCMLAGFPLGKGSPKNDPVCRAKLGLDDQPVDDV